MPQPVFEVESVNLGCFLIHDRGRTIAIVTPQGLVDWLVRSPLEPAPRLKSVVKETHLSYTLGLKFELKPPTPGGVMTAIDHFIEDEGKTLRLVGAGKSSDGKWESRTVAVLRADADFARYHWDVSSTLTNVSRDAVTLSWIEFNNVYPSKVGRCFLFEPEKQYNATVMIDRDGTAWKFPHQHLYHYSHKIPTLNFAEGTMGGFFGDPEGSPVVVINKSTYAPDWAICDMYYDLHCGARVPAPVKPGETARFDYTIKYISNAQSKEILAKTKNIPITEADRKAHDYPRIELGMNSFLRAVDIGGADDASGFRQRPPQKVWDREVGCTGKGSLRITNAVAEECAWSAEPPTQIPASRRLKIRAKVKTQNVEGRGVFIRVRYHTFEWNPKPHIDWLKTLESTPVNGTTPGWTEIVVPELEVPAEHVDYLIWLDVVLEGKGVTWVTDVDVNLEQMSTPKPSLEADSSKKKRKKVTTKATAGAGATR